VYEMPTFGQLVAVNKHDAGRYLQRRKAASLVAHAGPADERGTRLRAAPNCKGVVVFPRAAGPNCQARAHVTFLLNFL
jgi:hypothetical protein